jgi:LacI family transcriptional regulator
LGHTNVAAIAGWRHLANTTDRLAGFFDALHQAGLRPEASEVVYADFRRDRARELCHALLVGPTRPTAIFVSNNEMVIGAMQAIAELGLSCPRDVSLAGIDDFPWAETFAPRLTTSRQPIDSLAEHAVRILHKRVRGQNGPSERVVLTARLIVRDSCARPRPSAPKEKGEKVRGQRLNRLANSNVR